VLCLDATTGLMLWQHEYECPYSISYASGPRCTPTVDDGRVYVVGAEGNLLCLNTADGNLLWEKNFKRDYEAQTPLWGFCGHPLIVDDLLICLVGGEGSVAVAFDRVTGVERWRACSASEQGYCPPTLITVSGQQQLLIWDADKINSLVPATGELLWSTALKPSYGMSIMAPQVGRLDSQQVLFASGIGRVGALFALNQDRPEATVIWRGEPKSAVYCANSTPFIDGDTLYGCDCHTGMLTAVDLASGERLWETTAATTGSDRPAKHGTGFLVRQPAAEGGFLTWIFTETGDLLLTRLTREAYEERGRAHLLEPTNECFGRPVVWSHPAFADRCCFVRNDEELICVSLAELRPQD
jgi:outer membrane protein assembly factor BamB